MKLKPGNPVVAGLFCRCDGYETRNIINRFKKVFYLIK